MSWKKKYCFKSWISAILNTARSWVPFAYIRGIDFDLFADLEGAQIRQSIIDSKNWFCCALTGDMTSVINRVRFKYRNAMILKFIA